MRFPDGFLQEIKFRNDIEDIVSRYVPLKQNGSRLVACCPFHSEKTPSFTVYKDTKSYYCFGCGAGGDVIYFMMAIENIDYLTAVTKLADIAKIPIPEDDSEYRDKMIRQKRIIELNREAALYFHDNLISLKTDEGDKVREYLRKRGLKNATIKHFGLGYATSSWNSLTKYLSEKGYSKDEQRAAFLCGVTKKGDYTDYFRGRLMFPIIEPGGNVIAFGGRVIEGDGGGKKYLNSSDTPVFKKSRNLYALNFAKNSKRGYLIMCEGYMDVISMHQAGFTNTVATLGTAVTSEQARIISKYTNKVVLAYDSDDAGKKAMQKAHGLLSEAGIEVKVLSLDDAKDPDEFINKYGNKILENYLVKPKGYVETKLDGIYTKYDLDNPEDRIKALNESCEEISLINSEIEREVYGIKLAEKFKISSDNIIKEIKRQAAKRLKKEKSDFINGELRKISGYGDRINPDAVKSPAAVKIEEAILGLLMQYPEFYGDTKYILSEDMFITEFNKKIYTAFKNAVEDNSLINEANFDTALITKDFSPEETGRITKMIVANTANVVNIARAANSNNNVNINNIKNTLENLVESLKEQNKINGEKNINIKEIAAADDGFVKFIENKRLQEQLKKDIKR